MINPRDGNCCINLSPGGKPMLFLPVFLFFIGGIIISIRYLIKNIDREKYVFKFAWLLITLLPSVFSKEAPHALRVIGVVPVVYMFSALGMYYVYDIFRRKNLTHTIVIMCIFYFVIIVYNLHAYYYTWAQSQTANRFSGW